VTANTACSTRTACTAGCASAACRCATRSAARSAGPGSVSDIDAQKRVEPGAAASEERYQLAVRARTKGCGTGTAHDLLFLLPRAQTLLGASRASRCGRAASGWQRHVPPDDDARDAPALSAHLRGQTPHFAASTACATATANGTGTASAASRCATRAGGLPRGRLDGGRDRAPPRRGAARAPGGAAAPGAEAGGHRHAGRRHRARLQQHPRRHPWATARWRSARRATAPRTGATSTRR
jgi:hypothetical protein